MSTKERQIVHTKKLDEFDEVTVTQDLDTGNVRVEYHGSGNMGEAPIQLDYKAAEEIPLKGKKGSVRTKEEFSAVESEPRIANWDGDIEWDGENVVSKVDDLLTDTTKLETYATGKNPNIKKLLKSEQKQKYVNKLHDDQMEQINYIENKTGHMAPESLMDEPLPDDYPFASGGRVPLAGGGGLLNLFKMLFKKKPAKLENLKDFIDRRKFIQTLILNTDDMKNKRMLQKILEEQKALSKHFEKNPPFKFDDEFLKPGSDFRKEIEMILSKDITKHAEGGRVPMFKGGAAWKKFIESLFIKSSNEIRRGEGIWKGLTQEQWIKQHDNLTKKLKEWELNNYKKLPPGMKEYFGMNEIQLVNAFKKAETGAKELGVLEKFIPKGKPHASGGLAGMLGE